MPLRAQNAPIHALRAIAILLSHDKVLLIHDLHAKWAGLRDRMILNVFFQIGIHKTLIVKKIVDRVY